MERSGRSCHSWPHGALWPLDDPLGLCPWMVHGWPKICLRGLSIEIIINLRDLGHYSKEPSQTSQNEKNTKSCNAKKHRFSNPPSTKPPFPEALRDRFSNGNGHNSALVREPQTKQKRRCHTHSARRIFLEGSGHVVRSF